MSRACTLFFVLLTACAIGAPPGFSSGDQWVFPLVDPLANDRLMTPVMVDGKGPYLFVIDPDADETMMDAEVVARGEFRAKELGRVVDEQDRSHPAFLATVTNIKIGNLTISQRTVLVGDNGAFNTERRRIYGVIGRDVLADSIVFGFDRERGIAWLETQQAFKPEPGAFVLPYWTRNGRDSRHLVTTKIDGVAYDLHLDMGDVPSQLRPEHWAKAKLKAVAWNMRLVDAVGHRRNVSVDGIADVVEAGPVKREKIGFVPYDDRRWDYGILEGTLGLDFFRPFAVAADWHHKMYYLSPRQKSATSDALRLARWGTSLPVCAAKGCVSMEMVAQDGQAVVHVVRDPAAKGVPLEVVWTASGATGAELPLVYASLPAGVDEVANALDSKYAGATLELADVSPYPYACEGCVVPDLPVPP